MIRKTVVIGNFHLCIDERANNTYIIIIGLDFCGTIYYTNFASSYYGSGFKKNYQDFESADYSFEDAKSILDKRNKLNDTRK